MSWMDDAKTFFEDGTATERYNKLVNMCVDIFAHNECDFEWTNSKGNGINCSEAAGVAMEVIEILGVDYNDPEIEDRIIEAADKLEQEYGY